MLRPARRVLGRPGKFAEKGCACEVIPVALRLVDAVGAMVLTLPKDLTDEGAKTQVGLAVNELHHRFQGKSIPELDFENDLGLGGDEFHDAMGTWLKAESDLKSHSLYAASIKDGGLNEAQIATYRAKASLMERAVALKKEIKTTQLSKFREELRHRSRVLCKFGMLTEDGVVTRKGRAACEIDTADELLVTELMFNGCFVAMDHHALVALCAMFMPVEKTKEVKSLTGAAKEALDPAVKQLKDTARAIAEAEIEFGVRTAVNDGEDGRHEAVNEYVDSFKDALVGVVYNWSKGTHFDEIMRDTDLFEGTVVRCMRRLDELMMELHRAARAVGSEELATCVREGCGESEARRGIRREPLPVSGGGRDAARRSSSSVGIFYYISICRSTLYSAGASSPSAGAAAAAASAASSFACVSANSFFVASSSAASVFFSSSRASYSAGVGPPRFALRKSMAVAGLSGSS